MDESIYKPLHAPHCAVVCSNCNLREICLPVGLTKQELETVDARLVAQRHKVARGDRLFQAGDRFDPLFAENEQLPLRCQLELLFQLDESPHPDPD